MVITSAFVGGKLFFFMGDPGFYFSSFHHLTRHFRSGFVFYGSLLFAIPVIIWYFRKNRWPVWHMLDRIAITACIIHGIGRLGCFFAGCCHGVETDVAWAITFTNTACKAPLNTPLHPTQLYSVTLIFSILIALLLFKKHKRFEGRLFFIYVVLYASGRIIIELFRGDVEKSYIIENALTLSQCISIIAIVVVVAIYFGLRKRLFKD